MGSQVSHIRLEDAAPYRALPQFVERSGAAAQDAKIDRPAPPKTLLGLPVRAPILCPASCASQDPCARRPDAA